MYFFVTFGKLNEQFANKKVTLKANIVKDRGDTTFDPCVFLSLSEFLDAFSGYLTTSMGIRTAANKCKISFGHLSDVLSKKRPLSDKFITRWSAGSIITPRGAAYLRSLREYEVTNDPRERLTLLRELNAIGEHLPVHKEMKRQDIALSQWYVSTVRKLLQHPRVSGDAKNIAAAMHLGPTERDLQKTLKAYEQAGIIEQDDKGRWKSKQRVLLWGTKSEENLFLHDFHNNMLARSQQALQDPFSERELQALTFLGDPGQLKEMKRYVDSFLERFYQKFGQELDGSVGDESQVFQLNLQLFQTSRI
ncbi:MAG: TIGR02147 family protein [Oligoflexales bacterium]